MIKLLYPKKTKNTLVSLNKICGEHLSQMACLVCRRQNLLGRHQLAVSRRAAVMQYPADIKWSPNWFSKVCERPIRVYSRRGTYYLRTSRTKSKDWMYHAHLAAGEGPEGTANRRVRCGCIRLFYSLQQKQQLPQHTSLQGKGWPLRKPPVE